MDIIKRNNVKILGKGSQPIVFSHGFGCDQNMWRFVYPAFVNEYKIILFDHVGSGKSDCSAYSSHKYKQLKGYATDVLEICELLHLEEVIFVGHSVSAMIGVLAANRKPEVFSHLILVAPSPCYFNDTNYQGGFDRSDIEQLLASMENNYLGWSKTLAPVIMKNPDKPELTEELSNSFCATDPDIAGEFARTTFLSDNRPDLLACQIPSLIIQCNDDALAPIEVGEYMHTRLKTSCLDIINATGHCPNLSAPLVTTRSIKKYLSTKY